MPAGIIYCLFLFAFSHGIRHTLTENRVLTVVCCGRFSIRLLFWLLPFPCMFFFSPLRMRARWCGWCYWCNWFECDRLHCFTVDLMSARTAKMWISFNFRIFSLNLMNIQEMASCFCCVCHFSFFLFSFFNFQSGFALRQFSFHCNLPTKFFSFPRRSNIVHGLVALVWVKRIPFFLVEWNSNQEKEK